MHLVAISDWRIQPISDIHRALDMIGGRPDLLLYAGDDTGRFARGPNGNEFTRLAQRTRLGVAGVIGNDCSPEHRHILDATGVRDVHMRPLRAGRFGIVGLEASPGPRGIITYREEDAARHLRRSAAYFPKGTPLIVVSHAPPHGVLDLAARFGVERIGSKALLAFMREYDVRLVICGHVHLQGGQSVQVGNCWVVNTANHDHPGAPGQVAVINLEEGSVRRVSWVRPQQQGVQKLLYCQHQHVRRLILGGIQTLDDVLVLSPEHLAAMTGVKLKMARLWQLHARAIKQGCFLPKTPTFTPTPYPKLSIYYDIETLPGGRGDLVWLIGVLLPGQRRVVQMLARKPDEEPAILENFMDIISSVPGATLVCYSGNNFDHHYITRRLEYWHPTLASHFRARKKLDLLNYVRQHAVPPCTGYGLKEVTEALGSRRRHALSGVGLAMQYLYYLQGRDKRRGFPWQVALEYNEDDVLAMPLLLRHLFIDVLSHESGANGQAVPREWGARRKLSRYGLAKALAEWSPSWTALESAGTTTGAVKPGK